MRWFDEIAGEGYDPSVLLIEFNWGDENYKICGLCGENPEDCWCGEEFRES